MDFCKSNTLLLIVIVSLSSLFLFTNAVRPTITPSLHVHSKLDEHTLQIQPRLSKLCEKTSNPILCANSISPFVHGAIKPIMALKIEVDATMTQTKKTAEIIAHLLANHANSKKLNDALQVCKKEYASIEGSIKETQDAIAKDDVIEAKFKFSAVMSYQSTCKDAFDESKFAFPFAPDSEAVFQLGGNCLDIIANIETDEAPPSHVPVQSTDSAFSNVVGTIS